MLNFLKSNLLLISVILVAVYFYLKLCVYNYWKKLRIPHESPSIPLGNLNISLFTGYHALGNFLWDSYKNFGKYRFHGFYVFNRPVLMINDPELIKLVLIKEFQSFHDRGWFYNDKLDPLSSHLFVLPGEPWERLRKKFTPVFTPAKVRQIYPLMDETCAQMLNTCDALLKDTSELNIFDMIGRFTTDVISSVVYGFNGISLKTPDNDFRRLGMKGFEFGGLNMLLGVFFPDFLKYINIPFFHKDVTEFFTKIFAETIDYRRKEKVFRQDFMNLLMQLVDKGVLDGEQRPENDIKERDRITVMEAAAQAFVFFVAGFETSSSAIAYCLFELAMHPDIQDKLYEEIEEVAGKVGLTHDSILEMEYLEQVFLETLRKYPGVAFLNRICGNDLPIPESNFVVPKGMRIVISVLGLHYDPKHFPNPHEFNPSRFSKENSANRSPYINLAFGTGPRNCIGQRFGTMQSKLAIVRLVQRYKFSISQKSNLPVKFTSESLVVAPEQEIYLRFQLRRK